MKIRRLQALGLAIAGAAALTIAGCGGSGGSVPATTTSTPTASASLTGTAATGAALANANVTVTDSSGNSPCQESSITTSALGSFTCTLKPGETAPFFVVVTDPTGNTPPLVSVATTTPAAGLPLTVNATPLTTAIVAQLASDGNALTVVNSKTIDSAALKAATANVVAQLASVLSSIGAPAGYDPFSTSITATTASAVGNTADQVLDVVKVVTDPATGKLALSTVDNPTPVLLATALSSGSSLATPSASVSALAQAAQIVAQSFNACFALPTSQRVQSTTTVAASLGGPDLTSSAPACQNTLASTNNAAGIAFQHNGYDAGQWLYSLMTVDTMTGAQFSVPEIMAFYPGSITASGVDEATLNIKYVDANGNPGNLVAQARNIAGTSSAARPSSWWLTGNQQPVDVSVKLNIRRVEQLNSSNTGKFSTFQSGFQFNVNFRGPGSIRNTNALNLARITGPGLPTGGIVYVASTGAQNTMDLFNKTGSLSGGSQCGNGTTYNCPNVWLSRTQGISGAGATTLATNQTGLAWAQPVDGFDPSKIVKGSKYKVELFYGSNTGTADVTFNKTLLSDLVPATQAVNLPWNTLGANSQAALNPTGTLTGAQAALPVDWVQNPAAQQISGVQAVTDTTSGGFGPTKNVPRGATSAILDNMTVPVLNTTNPVGRTLLFSYRMLDTSQKTSVFTYN